LSLSTNISNISLAVSRNYAAIQEYNPLLSDLSNTDGNFIIKSDSGYSCGLEIREKN